jgi:hypothetical protein
MDVEKTIEFIMEHQAQAEVRMERLERAISQTNSVVNQLVRYGVSLRSDVRRLDKAMARLAEVHAETDEKLNALVEVHAETDGKLNVLIDLVDKTIRRNGR